MKKKKTTEKMLRYINAKIVSFVDTLSVNRKLHKCEYLLRCFFDVVDDTKCLRYKSPPILEEEEVSEAGRDPLNTKYYDVEKYKDENQTH